MGGFINKTKGKIKQAVGSLTGNQQLKQEGTLDELKGHAEGAGQAIKGAAQDTKKAVKDAVSSLRKLIK